MIAIKEENVITIEFEGHDTLESPMLYQYDKGQKIKFLDVPDGVEVQFSNWATEMTKNKIVVNGQVEIPDILLQENKKILAYLKIINSDSETTIKTVIIPVKARTKPADYIEPEQEKPFRKYVEEKLENAEKLVAEANDKVKVNEECLKQIDIKTEQSVNQIAEATNGKIKDIANVTNAKLGDINNTASAQIFSINEVSYQNAKSGIEAVNAAARAQIGGIETVANAQKKGITETAQGKIKDINNTATSQINAINKTAQAQAQAIEKQGNEIKQEGKEILDKIEKAGGANAIVPNAALIWNTNKSGTWNTHLTESAEYPIKEIELRKSYNNTTTFTPSLDNPPQLGFNKKVTLYVLNKTSTNINDAVYSIPFEYDLNGCKFDNTNYYNTLTFDRERGQIRYYNIVQLIKFSELKGTKWKATKDEAKGWLKVQYDTFKDGYSSLNPTRNICNIAEQGEDEVGKYKIAEDNNTIILWLDLTRFTSLQDWLDYIEKNDVQLLTLMFNGIDSDISDKKELFEKFLKLQTYNLKTSFILDNKEIGVKEVTYAADIKTYIDNKIASIQTTTE